MLDGQIHRDAEKSLMIAGGGGAFGGSAIAHGPLFSPSTAFGLLFLLGVAFISLEIHPSAEEVAIAWREHEALSEEEVA